jgi:hypothetical protein
MSAMLDGETVASETVTMVARDERIIIKLAWSKAVKS